MFTPSGMSLTVSQVYATYAIINIGSLNTASTIQVGDLVTKS